MYYIRIKDLKLKWNRMESNDSKTVKGIGISSFARHAQIYPY